MGKKMKRRINKGLLTSLVIAMAISLIGCTGQKDNTIHIGVMYSSDIIPLAIMTEKNLDEKYGFQLDMQVFQSAKDRDAALQAGELDGVFTDYIGMCMYQNAGLEMKITGVTDGDYVLLAGKDTKISSLMEAKGKEIAISENTLIEYSLDFILDKNQLDTNYLSKKVVPRIPDRLEMLRNGSIDLGLLPDPFSTLAEESDAIVLGSANEFGLYPAVCAFDESAIKEKKELINKMYKAYNEAVDYINNTDIKEYENLVIKTCGYPEELSGKIKLPTYRKHTLPTEEELTHAISWASKKGLCSSDLKPEQLLGRLE